MNKLLKFNRFTLILLATSKVWEAFLSDCKINPKRLSNNVHLKVNGSFQIFLTFACAIYVFAFVSICVCAGFLAIIRLACIINLNFMEESIGEQTWANQGRESI